MSTRQRQLTGELNRLRERVERLQAVLREVHHGLADVASSYSGGYGAADDRRAQFEALEERRAQLEAAIEHLNNDMDRIASEMSNGMNPTAIAGHILDGLSELEISRRYGVGRGTVIRWMANPTVVELVAKARAAMEQRLSDKVATCRLEALDELRQMMKNQNLSPSVRCRAAIGLLTATNKNGADLPAPSTNNVTFQIGEDLVVDLIDRVLATEPAPIVIDVAP